MPVEAKAQASAVAFQNTNRIRPPDLDLLPHPLEAGRFELKPVMKSAIAFSWPVGPGNVGERATELCQLVAINLRQYLFSGLLVQTLLNAPRFSRCPHRWHRHV